MKKILYTLLLSNSFFAIAQQITPDDALRYAINNMNGTARFKAMGGAFGAIGGDLSAININPAGSVVFNNNYGSISVSSNNKNNTMSYFNNSEKENHSALNLNQIGAVLVFDAKGTSNWNKIAFSLNYENTNNFDNTTYVSGINPTNSIDKYFLRFANGIGTEGVFDISNANAYYEDLSFIDQQAWLGYNSYIIEHDALNNNYYTNVPDNSSYSQSKISKTSGFNGKVSANIATSFKDRLYLGMNLNLHVTDYTNLSTLRESNNGLYSSGTSISYIRFDNEQYTFGNGFSLNLGAIAKVTDEFRIGLAYESPTWYNLTDQLTQYIYTERTESPNDNDYLSKITNPNITIEYAPYKLQTPSKVTGSLAYIFGTKGMISADFSKKDYSGTKFKPNKDYSSLNSYMKTNLTDALEYRIGGEYKIKRVSLRAGYRFEESPYKTDNLMGDLKGYSGGFGYNFGESKLDFAFSNDSRNFKQRLISAGMTDSANAKQINNNITVTYSINF